MVKMIFLQNTLCAIFLLFQPKLPIYLPLLTKERSPFYKKSSQVQLELLNPESSPAAETQRQGDKTTIKLEQSEFEQLEEHHSPVMTFSQPPNRITEESETNQILKLYKKRSNELICGS